MNFFILLLTISTSAWAFDSGKCSGMLNKGLYKKYKWGGIGEANSKAITAETKRVNTLVATGNISTEGTTAVSDPKYSSNVSTSNSQGTSSWGECSAFAINERKEQRDLYVEQNLEQIKKDIANGRGSHLEALSWFSLCEDKALIEFNQTLQKHMQDLLVTESSVFSQNIDKIIKAHDGLSKDCYVLSAN